VLQHYYLFYLEMSKDKKKEKTCVGCKYHAKCAGGVFGSLGFQSPNIVSGKEKNEWCHNYKDLEKNK